jgi:hypothetical protein
LYPWVFSIIQKIDYEYGSENGGSSVPSAMEWYAGLLLISCHMLSLPCRAQVFSPVECHPRNALQKTKNEIKKRFRFSAMCYETFD